MTSICYICTCLQTDDKNFMFKEFYSSLTAFSKKIASSLKNKYLLILLILPLLSYIFYAATVPVNMDEAYMYLTFTSKPFFNTIATFPELNNHVIHTITTQLTKHLPFLGVLFKMRISSIIVSIMTWVVAYIFVRKYYSEKVALITVAITSMMFLSVYYGFMSRGYAYAFLFFMICLYATFNIIKKGSKNIDWTYYTIGAALCLYTVPSMLYALAMLNLLILIYDYRHIKKQIVFNLIMVAVVLVLYSPILINQGTSVFVADKVIIPHDRIWTLRRLPFFAMTLLDGLYGVPFWVVLPFIVFFFYMAIKKRDKWELSLWLIFGIMPFLLLFIHSVIPFERTFNYYAFLLTFLMCIAVSGYIDKLKIKYIITFCIVIQLFGFFNFMRYIPKYEWISYDSHEINEKTLTSPENTYYMARSYNCTIHEFETTIRGWRNKAFYDVNAWWPIDADTLTTYTFVIMDAGADHTKINKPYFVNEYQHLYKNESKK